MNLWNSLPSEAVEAPSLNIFNKKINSFLKNKGLRGMVFGLESGAVSTKDQP